MTKPTILILVTVYLASILIVGLFGMQAGGLVENDIASITLTEDGLEFNKDKNSLDILFVEQAGDKNYSEYNILIGSMPKDALVMKLTPIIRAENPNLDPTNSDLRITPDLITPKTLSVTNTGLTFTIEGYGQLRLKLSAQDDSGKSMIVFLIFDQPKA